MWNAVCSALSWLRPIDDSLRLRVVEPLFHGGAPVCSPGRSFQEIGCDNAGGPGFELPRVSTMPSTAPTMAIATTTAASGQNQRDAVPDLVGAFAVREGPVRRCGA